MLLIVNYIKTMPADTEMNEFCRGVTEMIRQCYQEQGIDLQHLRQHPTERLTASAIVYSRRHDEIWMVGDCQCLVDGVLHDNPKPYEAEIAKRRAQRIRELLDKGRSISDLQQRDEGREFILPDLIASCRNQNKTYAVIDGFDIPLDKVKVAKGGHEMVLASDGYPHLCPTLSESEAALSKLLAEDPLCISLHPATKGLMKGQKSFDDRAYIRFQR